MKQTVVTTPSSLPLLQKRIYDMLRDVWSLSLQPRNDFIDALNKSLRKIVSGRNAAQSPLILFHTLVDYLQDITTLWDWFSKNIVSFMRKIHTCQKGPKQ